MDAGMFVPLALPLTAWPLARAAHRAPPRLAVWLLTGTAVALAAGSTAALCLLSFAGLSLVPAVARFGEWSPQTLAPLEPAGIPFEVASGVALLALVVSTVVWAVRHARRVRAMIATVGGAGARGELVVLRDTEPVAFAVAARGGRIVVSQSMLRVLTPAERCALLTHERAHLEHRHHRFLLAVSAAAALNPVLRPLRSAVVFQVERWADEVAGAAVGSRRTVASAIGKAALASREVPAPAATAGPVPRRVAALLGTPPSGWRLVAALCTAIAFAVVTWSAQASLEAAADLHTGIEVASVGHCPHHTPTA